MPLRWGFSRCFEHNSTVNYHSSEALLPIKPSYLNRYRYKVTDQTHQLYVLLLLDLLRLYAPSLNS